MAGDRLPAVPGGLGRRLRRAAVPCIGAVCCLGASAGLGWVMPSCPVEFRSGSSSFWAGSSSSASASASRGVPRTSALASLASSSSSSSSPSIRRAVAVSAVAPAAALDAAALSGGAPRSTEDGDFEEGAGDDEGEGDGEGEVVEPGRADPIVLRLEAGVLVDPDEALDELPEALDAADFLTVLAAVARPGQPSEGAVRWFDAMEARGLAANVDHFNAVLKAFIAGGELVKAESWFERLQQSGITPDGTTFARIISVASRARDPGEEDGDGAGRVRGRQVVKDDEFSYSLAAAVRWFERMEASGVDVGLPAILAMARACAKAKRKPMAEEYLGRLEKYSLVADENFHHGMLRAYAQANMTEEVTSSFRLMEADGVTPTVSTFNIVIRAYVRVGLLDRALQWLRRMEAFGFAPDATTCADIAQVHIAAGELTKVHELYGRIAEAGDTSALGTFSSQVARSLARARRPKEALEWANTAAEAGASIPILDLIEIKVQLAQEEEKQEMELRRKESWKQYLPREGEYVEPLYKKRRNTELDDWVKKEGIQALPPRDEEGNFLWDDVEEVPEDWGLERRADENPDPSTMPASERLYYEAKTLFKEATAAERAPFTDRNVERVVRTFAQVPKGLEMVMQWFEETGWRGRFGRRFFVAVVEACLGASDLEEAGLWLRRMQDEGHVVMLSEYSSFLFACVRSRGQRPDQLAVQILGEMLAQGVKPNVECYTSMVQAYGKGGQVDKAIEWFHRIRRVGRKPDIRAWKAVFDACFDGRRYHEAGMWFGEMEASGVTPSPKSYTMAVMACCKAARPLEAEQWMNSMQNLSYTVTNGAKSALASSWAEVGQPKKGVAVLRKAQAEDPTFKANGQTYASLVSALAEAHKPGEAWDMLDEMESVGHVPRNRVVNNILLAAVQQEAELFEKEPDLKRDERRRRFPIDVFLRMMDKGRMPYGEAGMQLWKLYDGFFQGSDQVERALSRDEKTATAFQELRQKMRTDADDEIRGAQRGGIDRVGKSAGAGSLKDTFRGEKRHVRRRWRGQEDDDDDSQRSDVRDTGGRGYF
mmetsp:Transcript_148187/g.475947  ORF Transcript_148187/g.475947 Transcript_148187/m.475947 type:complete len:1053 (-) Transcript_148187:133-3291(-)